jgi:type I restriction enzyme S subunit
VEREGGGKMSLVKIKDLFNFEKGTLQSSKCTPGDHIFITASNEWKTHNEYTHECEALVFAAAASGSLGRTHYVNDKFIASDLCFIITPKDQAKYPIDLKFYHIIFNTLKDEIVRNTKAGTSKEAIGLGTFGNYSLPYFEITRQKEIGKNFLIAGKAKSELQNELTHQLSLVKQLRQAFLREAMQGKLVPQNPADGHAKDLLAQIKAEKAKLGKKEKPLPLIKPEEIPFEIPEGWVWCRLGEVASLITSGSRNWNQFYFKEGDLFIRSQNIKPESLDLSNKAYVKLPSKSEGQRTAVFEDDILITITGASVSNCALVGNLDFPVAYVSQHIALIRLVNSKMAKWVHACLVSESLGKKQFAALIYGDKPGLNLVQISQLIIPLPTAKEQVRILSKVGQIMGFTVAIEGNIIEESKETEQLLKQVLREALIE